MISACACSPEVTVTSSSPAPFMSPRGIFNETHSTPFLPRRFASGRVGQGVYYTRQGVYQTLNPKQEQVSGQVAFYTKQRN